MTLDRTFYSILRDTDDIVDRFFGILSTGNAARYATRKTYLRNDLEAITGDPVAFLVDLHAKAAANWEQRIYRNAASRENWRCESFPEYDQGRDGFEVRLEREIVKGMGSPPWFNNVPTSSGFCGPAHDKARNVDLVEKTITDDFTFYELKWGTNRQGADSPIFAAIEIVYRGVLNLFTRLHREEMVYPASHSPMLTAPHIHLRVLGPYEFYHDDAINLAWLEKKMDVGLRSWLNTFPQAGLQMTFGFQTFPQGFAPPFDSASIRSAMTRRQVAYPWA